MKSSDLTEIETKVWQAAGTGTLVDLRVGDPKRDSPERGTKWGTERTVRAEVIADLLLGVGVAAAAHVRGVRLQGARITGCLDLEATTLGCPLALLDCFFASAINLNEATALSVRLSGAHVPALQAKQLLTRGDLWLDKGFCVSDGVDLAGAHIGGVLACTGGQFSNPHGTALSADRLTVDGGMYCNEGFVASGEVSLVGAHIGGQLSCREGQFSNPAGLALDLERATVSGPLHMETAVLEGILDLTAAKTSSYFDNREFWSQKLRPPGVAIRGDHLMIIWSGPEGYGEQFGGPDGEARVLQLPVVGFSR